jgi:hypothetical protein
VIVDRQSPEDGQYGLIPLYGPLVGENVVLKRMDILGQESLAEGWEGGEDMVGVVQGFEVGVQILLCKC